jgi:hypothetical protein
LPLKLYSNNKKPVTLPPGRAKLSTKPPPTGSATAANTIGALRLACCIAAKLKVPLARTMSRTSATSSAAYVRWRSTSSVPHRMSMRTV